MSCPSPLVATKCPASGLALPLLGPLVVFVQLLLSRLASSLITFMQTLICITFSITCKQVLLNFSVLTLTSH